MFKKMLPKHFFFQLWNSSLLKGIQKLEVDYVYFSSLEIILEYGGKWKINECIDLIRQQSVGQYRFVTDKTWKKLFHWQRLFLTPVVFLIRCCFPVLILLVPLCSLVPYSCLRSTALLLSFPTLCQSEILSIIFIVYSRHRFSSLPSRFKALLRSEQCPFFFPFLQSENKNFLDLGFFKELFVLLVLPWKQVLVSSWTWCQNISTDGHGNIYELVGMSPPCQPSPESVQLMRMMKHTQTVHFHFPGFHSSSESRNHRMVWLGRDL